MSYAMGSATKPIDTTIDQYKRSFANIFRKGSDRCLRGLYDDEVAPRLSEAFEALSRAGDGQIEVLNSVAELVGLEGLDLSQPLPDEAAEALAQRIAWRTTARWAVLGLLWTLIDNRPEPMRWDALAEATKASDRPRGGSGLPPETDEPTALSAAARGLAESETLRDGVGILLLDIPVVLRAHDGVLATTAVRPLALVETDSDYSCMPIELKAEDWIWLAGPETGFSVEGEFNQKGDVLAMTGSGALRPDSGTHTIAVVPGAMLLFQGDVFEDSR